MRAKKCPWTWAISERSGYARQKCFGVDGRFYICPVCDARKATAINRRDGAFREVLRDFHVFHLAA